VIVDVVVGTGVAVDVGGGVAVRVGVRVNVGCGDIVDVGVSLGCWSVFVGRAGAPAEDGVCGIAQADKNRIPIRRLKSNMFLIIFCFYYNLKRGE
jgi:hypothetical protein